MLSMRKQTGTTVSIFKFCSGQEEECSSNAGKSLRGRFQRQEMLQHPCVLMMGMIDKRDSDGLNAEKIKTG